MVRIIQRGIFEFGPPAGIALCAALYTGTGWLTFTGTFTALCLFWLSALRIEHQQETKAQQEDAAIQLNKVVDNLSTVEQLLHTLTPMVESIRANLSPQQAKAISQVVEQANTAISTANTSLGEVRNFRAFRFFSDNRSLADYPKISLRPKEPPDAIPPASSSRSAKSEPE